jgi:hypothetical protein
MALHRNLLLGRKAMKFLGIVRSLPWKASPANGKRMRTESNVFCEVDAG